MYFFYKYTFLSSNNVTKALKITYLRYLKI